MVAQSQGVRPSNLPRPLTTTPQDKRGGTGHSSASSRWGMGWEGLSQGHTAGQEDSELPHLGHRQLHLPELVGKSLSDFSRNGLC